MIEIDKNLEKYSDYSIRMILKLCVYHNGLKALLSSNSEKIKMFLSEFNLDHTHITLYGKRKKQADQILADYYHKIKDRPLKLKDDTPILPEKNLYQLTEIWGLNSVENDLLRLAFHIEQDDLLKDVFNAYKTNNFTARKIFATLLDCSKEDIIKATLKVNYLQNSKLLEYHHYFSFKNLSYFLTWRELRDLDINTFIHSELDEYTLISLRIEKILADLGIKARVKYIQAEFVVTHYEIYLSLDTKFPKVITISRNLAKKLAAEHINVTELLSNKSYMMIETPHFHYKKICLQEILNSNKFLNSDAKLPIALGKDINEQPVVTDIQKMSHLLVVGQTGSGKSRLINAIIVSLLHKCSPEKLRFIMIDTRGGEFGIYNDIPHLLSPVITNMKKAINTLNWVVNEMKRRYALFLHLNVNNIETYNHKIRQAEEMQCPIPDPTIKLESLSYIVVIIDEFSDLIMAQGKKVEEYIIWLGQIAQVMGIHLILTTQRSSADITTSLIKSNIPSRIAFKISSQIDAKTILDIGGAERLLEYGDTLYSTKSTSSIIRVHSAFMETNDIQKIADDWRAKNPPNYIKTEVTPNKAHFGSLEHDDLDPLFHEVCDFVIKSGVEISASDIQLQFSLGFPRADRILDQLQEKGIISEPNNRGKRKILY